jgi:LAS seventeen-binding protein 5
MASLAHCFDRKYGNTHRQLRALTILDGLIQNAGTRFQKTFADEPLLERLRIMARDQMVDDDVRKKCNVLFRQWANAYKGTPGLERIAVLYKELPKTARPRPDQSKVIRETEREAQSPTSPVKPSHGRHPSAPTAFPSSSTGNTVSIGAAPPVYSSSSFKKDKKSKNKPFNLEKEKPAMMETLASAGVASTNLQNALKLVNRENQRVSDNPEVMSRFETCKQLRRQILRYIQLVESDQWIGSLLSANDELVNALMSFEILDKSIDDDSDSEYEIMTSPTAGHGRKPSADIANQLAGLNVGEETPPAKPPRPTSIPMPPTGPAGKMKADEPESDEEEFDEDDPFGDQNAVKTPYVEQNGMTW